MCFNNKHKSKDILIAKYKITMNNLSRPRISYTKPSITKLEVDYATDAAKNGWGSNCYGYINKFEKLFANHLGVKHVIATSSCTGALHMGLYALEINKNDEIILADTNWIATAAPISHLGATPVFVDILSDTWCLDPKKVEAAITNKTKAIIATHLYGNLCEMNELIEISDRYKIPIIEDKAEGIGASYKGKKAGTIGLFSTFSFHGTKTVTTGEGGMFATNNTALYKKVLTLSNHGRDKNQLRQFWPTEIGFKYKISNIQAAIGCAQIERIEELIHRKREILKIYKNKLSKYKHISLNPEPKNTQNGAWMPTAVFDEKLNISRDKLINAFKDANIDARVFFYPLSSLDFFEDCIHNVNSWDIPSRAVNLPSYHDMTLEDIERVCSVIKKLVTVNSSQQVKF